MEQSKYFTELNPDSNRVEIVNAGRMILDFHKSRKGDAVRVCKALNDEVAVDTSSLEGPLNLTDENPGLDPDAVKYDEAKENHEKTENPAVPFVGKKVEQIHNSQGGHFNGDLRPLLLTLLTMADGKDRAFVAVTRAEGMILGVATENEKGFHVAPAQFLIRDYNIASDIAEDLNRDAFGHTMKRSHQIKLSSFGGV